MNEIHQHHSYKQSPKGRNVAISHWCKFFFFLVFFFLPFAVFRSWVACCTWTLLLHSSFCGERDKMMGEDGWDYQTETWWRVVPLWWGEEHARSPRGCVHGEGRGLGAKMDKWEQWATVLPVAVGHGILSLLLLEELCDGQQLFQYVLNDRKSRKWLFSRARRELWGKSSCCSGCLTCCAPRSLLRVRSSSECVAQTSCSAAKSRDRSALNDSGCSGRSGTFYKHRSSSSHVLALN